jgi:hypothetical protein
MVDTKPFLMVRKQDNGTFAVMLYENNGTPPQPVITNLTEMQARHWATVNDVDVAREVLGGQPPVIPSASLVKDGTPAVPVFPTPQPWCVQYTWAAVLSALWVVLGIIGAVAISHTKPSDEDYDPSSMANDHGGWIFWLVVAVVIAIIITCVVCHQLTPWEKAKSRYRASITQAENARINEVLRTAPCPVCGARNNRVNRYSGKRKTGKFSTGKASAAVLTGGWSILATGLAAKEKYHSIILTCTNCGTVRGSNS